MSVGGWRRSIVNALGIPQKVIVYPTEYLAKH